MCVCEADKKGEEGGNDVRKADGGCSTKEDDGEDGDKKNIECNDREPLTDGNRENAGCRVLSFLSLLN